MKHADIAYRGDDIGKYRPKALGIHTFPGFSLFPLARHDKSYIRAGLIRLTQ